MAPKLIRNSAVAKEPHDALRHLKSDQLLHSCMTKKLSHHRRTTQRNISVEIC